MNGKRVRTVELQLLRQGPPHNQLLSPLTDYLALCEDHPNTTLNFPLEHQSLRVRLHALRYRDSEETRKIQLHETASLVAGMFADVPGLISELGHRDSSAEALVHLSIATTASELSLVPFELASSPPGFPGSGGPLSLQTEFPVCITRRSRKVRFDSLKWDVRPRVLMVASDAGGSIPLKSHYALLRKLMDPWIYRDPLHRCEKTWNSPDGLDSVRRHLTLVEDADVRKIRNEIHRAIEQRRPYTHIHVLAHGCPLPNQEESHGVALHMADRKGIDAVDGMRLGQLFTARQISEKGDSFSADPIRPKVVTLAVCDSGQQAADMARPSASVAFNIHEAGIPLVVGSQFPLTKSGSVILAESIYRQLLRGSDPRISLWEARRELFAQSNERLASHTEGRHDWASIVVFAAFPPDIEEGAKKLESYQHQKRMNLRLRAGDNLLKEGEPGAENTAAPPGPEKPSPNNDGEGEAAAASPRQTIAALATNIRREVYEFDQFVAERSSYDDYVDLLGISASANKRAAELLWAGRSGNQSSPQPEPDNASSSETQEAPSDGPWLECVWKSYRGYLLVSERDKNRTWAFVQALFLKRFLTFYSPDPQVDAELKSDDADNQQYLAEDSLHQEWFRAKYLCPEGEQPGCKSTEQRIWDLTDRIELGLLRLLIPWFRRDLTKSPTKQDLQKEFDQEKLLAYANTIEHLAKSGSRRDQFAAYAGRRQVLRYRRFANMMYPLESERKRYRKRSSSDHTGYDRLIKKHERFGVVYSALESLIKEQIEVGEYER